MSKVTKADLLNMIQEQANAIAVAHTQITSLIKSSYDSTTRLIALEGGNPINPQLKTLEHSVFDGLDEKWRFAAVDGSKGFPVVYEFKPCASELGRYYTNRHGLYKDLTHLTGYDTTDWQNSLIEREKAELTGSDLCRAMLARGDRYVMCYLSHTSEESAKDVKGIVIGSDHSGFRVLRNNSWQHAIPINNQGEPLTQSEAGL